MKGRGGKLLLFAPGIPFKGKKAAIVCVGMALAFVAALTPLSGTIDRTAYDLLLRNIQPSDEAPPRVEVIGMDTVTIDNLKVPLVLWYGYFAKIVDALTAAGAKGVVFDLIPAITIERFAPEPEKEFLVAVKAARANGVPVFVGFKAGDVGAQMPHPKFLFTVSGIGYVNLFPDEDGRIRRQRLYATDEDGILVPSLALVASLVETEKLGQSREFACARLGGCGASSKSELLIDYRVGHGKVRLHSFGDVLEAAERGDTAYFKERFAGRVALIGPASDKFPDNHPVPLNPATGAPSFMAGVLIQAQIVLSFMSDHHFKEVPVKYQRLLLVIVALFTAVMSIVLAPMATLVSAAVMAALYILAVIAGFSSYLVIPLSPMVIGIVVPVVVCGGYRYLDEASRFKLLRRYFGSYVSHSVMEEILKNPGKINFEGTELTLTIMFTDIRNFTALSEKLDSKTTVAGLNKYLGAMTGAITASGGYVNRYLGDGILALYGAPNALPNQGALEAVRGALAMRVELERLNKEGNLFPGVEKLKIGIGLHTGSAVVGNVGCHEKMDYTVIGDSANLASRVEGLTKNYGVDILITESVFERVKKDVEASLVDTVLVKGRVEEVKVYQVISLRTLQEEVS